MKQNVRIFLYCLIGFLLLASCQKTNVSDLITYREIADENIQQYQKSVTLDSQRDALVLDSLDYTGEKISLRKGTTLKVLGLRGQVGSFKTKPIIFNKSAKEADVWLAELEDGRRVYVNVPEIHEGPERLSSKNVAIYFPHRHPRTFWGDTQYEEMDKGWKKVLFRLGNVVEFSMGHTLSHLLYKDGSFYRYKPMIAGMPQWLKRAVQVVLSALLLMLVFMFVVPWLSLNAIWHIRFLPNWVVKILCAILCYVLAFFIGGFLGVTAVGFVVWGLMLVSRYCLTIRDDVDWERCPHCHKLGIHYKDTKYGSWKHSRREWDRSEVKDVSHREHDEYTGVGVNHVKETIYHKGLKHYVGLSRSRSVTENLYCPHCHKEIKLYSTEEHYSESSQWK